MNLLEHPSLLGFEPLFNHLDFLSKQRGSDAYPPFDVLLRGESTLVVRVAVAGFTRNDLRVVAQPHQLLILGKRAPTETTAEATDVFHSGIALRGFQRRFALGPGLTVESANVADGILEVTLNRAVIGGDSGEEIIVEARQ